MMRVLRQRAMLLLGAALGLSSPLAQAQRDPTEPPAALGLPGAEVAAPAGPLGGAAGGSAMLVRDGKPYLMVGTRLHGPGDQLGDARIERITETEVWLREGTSVRKISQFEGIERRTVPPTPAATLPACPKKPPVLAKSAARSPKKALPIPACADDPVQDTAP